MPDKVTPGPLRGCPMPREAVCIHTRKVYDSCRDKDCLQDLRVYLTRCSQAALDSAINVKPRSAELIWAYVDVEPITFNRGFYTVDVRYFYRIDADAFSGLGRATPITGIATFDKRTILFGSEGSARIFSSQYAAGPDNQSLERTNLPIASVEVVDPVILGTKILEGDGVGECCPSEIPAPVCACFDDEILISDEGRKLYATLGQFSIIRLERDIQLLMPAYDICMPDKSCPGSAEDPCDLFQKIKFPVDEFFPPRMSDMIRTGNGNQKGCCGKR